MYYEILAYAINNGKTESEIKGLFEVQDNSNGEGPFISSWNVPGLAEPSQADIDAITQADIDLMVLKKTRTSAIAAITVTTQSGNEFQGDEISQQRISRASIVMDDVEVIKWKLKNNTWVDVTKAELEEALKLASDAQTNLLLLADGIAV